MSWRYQGPCHSDIVIISECPLGYKIQKDQQNILPENLEFVRSLERPQKTRYCFLQHIFLDFADVKGSKTNTKSQAYCFMRFTLMITEINEIRLRQ